MTFLILGIGTIANAPLKPNIGNTQFAISVRLTNYLGSMLIYNGVVDLKSIVMLIIWVIWFIRDKNFQPNDKIKK